jgi:hypothetical protein
MCQTLCEVLENMGQGKHIPGHHAPLCTEIRNNYLLRKSKSAKVQDMPFSQKVS